MESLLAVEEAFFLQITMESQCVLVDTKWLPVGAVKISGSMILLLAAKLTLLPLVSCVRSQETERDCF